MDATKVAMMVALVTLVASAVMPAQADAFFRIGAEARWIPVAAESMEEDGEALQANRSPASTGVGVRALFGFTYFSVGAKANVARHVYDDRELSYTQVDVNAHVRSGMPLTRLRFFGEVGPTLALNIGEVGYNATIGAEVDILGWPLVDMNLGIAGQYAHVPIGAGPDMIRENNGFRAMALLGVDFALID